jgi:chromosome segregation ATPase
VEAGFRLERAENDIQQIGSRLDGYSERTRAVENGIIEVREQVKALRDDLHDVRDEVKANTLEMKGLRRAFVGFSVTFAGAAISFAFLILAAFH